MARDSSTATTNADTFVQNLYNAATEVTRIFAIDQDHPIDIFNSPLVFDSTTDTLAEQEEAVYHRASIEAFAAKVYQTFLSDGNVDTDTIIDKLALDLQSDGIIDNAANGKIIGGIDPAILAQDPLGLSIPNTSYQVKDTVSLMEDERIPMATSNGPTILVSTTPA